MSEIPLRFLSLVYSIKGYGAILTKLNGSSWHWDSDSWRLLRLGSQVSEILGLSGFGLRGLGWVYITKIDWRLIRTVVILVTAKRGESNIKTTSSYESQLLFLSQYISNQELGHIVTLATHRNVISPTSNITLYCYTLAGAAAWRSTSSTTSRRGCPVSAVSRWVSAGLESRRGCRLKKPTPSETCSSLCLLG